MSDTPRTDAEAYWLELHEVVQVDFARELERENAALKVQIRELIATMEEEGEMDAVRIAELKKENAALRADKERLDFMLNAGTGRDLSAVWRAAIDAARKEAQP